jgi:hypothetical protein
MVFLPACTDFLNPEQDIEVNREQLYDDWYEYRAVAMGLYGLQQKLAEQLVVLGELRGDLLTITPNADADLIEIYNFKATRNNKYADPTNFFKLISACNSFIHEMKKHHPEVMDKKAAVTNYDRIYAEALSMRAWAYFNAARIYGRIPVIHESLTSVAEIEEYLNSSSTYKDKTYIVFGKDGFKNDTSKVEKEIVLEKQFYDLDLVLRIFTKQLEEEVKMVEGQPAVGVNYYIDNNDKSWEVTTWNPFAWRALLGQMYLTLGDLSKSAKYLSEIINVTSDNYRYQLDQSFAYNTWGNIFTNIDGREHIFSLWFNKANQQQNDFQRLFEPYAPHDYMLKPTKVAIHLWETQWRGYNLIENLNKPELTKLNPFQRGFPSDFYRGHGIPVEGFSPGVSYQYVKNGEPLSNVDVMRMLLFKMDNDYRTVASIMDGVDTIVYKYSINKERYDQDASLSIYRAAGMHLYLAEIYNWWTFLEKGQPKQLVTNVSALFDGSFFDPRADRRQLGLRGRVGFTGNGGGLLVGNINYIHNPFTNEVIGFKNLTGDLLAKQLYLEELLMDERARELAFEGERFYDLMRVAKRRNDPSFLAKKVSAKYYNKAQRDAIYAHLLNEKNWYINIFD